MARRRRDRLAGWVTARAYTVGWAVVRTLPLPVASAVFGRGADLAVRRRGRGARRLEANLRRVVGPDVEAAALQALVRAAMRSYARYWLEVFRLPVTSPERIVGGMRMRDEHLLREAYAAGRGVVVVLPHSGNWDHAGAWACLTGMPLTTVAERLEPADLFDRFVAFRESLGFEVLPLTGGARQAFDVLSERLRQGRLVCLLGDRDLTSSGVEVDFFGGRAKMPAGPAVLALRTGAPLLPVSLWYDGDDWGARIHPAVAVPTTGPHSAKVRAMTQALADAFGEGIAAHPEDWHMLQRLWVQEPHSTVDTVAVRTSA